jgi:predicted transcriptional regulator
MNNVKQAIKESEARILVYLSVVHNTRKNVTAISHKLNIDYSYLLKVLGGMKAKGWLIKHPLRAFMYYDLTRLAPLEEAKKLYNMQGLQQDLQQTYSQVELKGDENEMDQAQDNTDRIMPL